MIKNPIFSMSATLILLFGTTCFANVYEKDFGTIGHGEVVRTFDNEFKNICYSVQAGVSGANGTQISCVTKPNVISLQSPQVVGHIVYGVIKRIWDEDAQVVCYIVQASAADGVSITCK